MILSELWMFSSHMIICPRMFDRFGACGRKKKDATMNWTQFDSTTATEKYRMRGLGRHRCYWKEFNDVLNSHEIRVFSEEKKIKKRKIEETEHFRFLLKWLKTGIDLKIELRAQCVCALVSRFVALGKLKLNRLKRTKHENRRLTDRTIFNFTSFEFWIPFQLWCLSLLFVVGIMFGSFVVCQTDTASIIA